ncbi:MmgE/PrpD family protein [Fodinicurvata sp. EGI_FJ10296]|uniref:MmgE/PrpD family protein n=1 Tax=Fodinicurvata sp. EGI_FJ10296 TaxID=3231908 RepID=UPI00345241DD
MTGDKSDGSAFEGLKGLSAAASSFTVGLKYDDISAEALRIGRRCILDGLAVSLAGSEQPLIDVLDRHITRIGGAADARVIGDAGRRVPVHLAALWNGSAGHAMDWDDTQLAEGPGRPYGLLMHPTMPPLAAALAVSDLIAVETGRPVSGKDFMVAFQAGFEVGCKVAEAIDPDHYMLGFHTSGTIGTFAAAATAAKLLGLNVSQTAQALGIAASMASGIRAGFGTMTKPLHVGRAAENGVTAAMLVREGFTGSEEGFDGRWGYLAVAGRGGDPERINDRFGRPLTIESPGVSIKPYPSGVLTHPSMDAMRFLMEENALTPDDIEEVTLFAGWNVLAPIRYEIAKNELEGKFSFAFLLSAIILAGRAGKTEFTDAFVGSDACQTMQRRVSARFDQNIEDMGWDRIRSRVVVKTRDGRTIERWADENYRGSPHNPLSDAEVEGKFRDCALGILDEAATAKLIEAVWKVETLSDATVLYDLLSWKPSGAAVS